MKRAEYLLLILSLLFLAFCGGYFLGTAQSDRGVSIATSPPQQTQPRESISTAVTDETQTTEIAPGLININTATLEELITLPGVGETIARNIVDYRQAHGAFTTIEALNEVPGIGEKRLEQIRTYITLEESYENTGS